MTSDYFCGPIRPKDIACNLDFMGRGCGSSQHCADDARNSDFAKVASLQPGKEITWIHFTTCFGLLPFWREQRDHLPSVPPINAKVAVEREDAALGVDFRHAHQTRVSQ
jgi:hypothetical protein